MSQSRPHEDALSLAFLKEFIHYNPNTGIFTWLKVPPHSRVKAGDTAGNGVMRYPRISLNNWHYSAHRLAFFYITGAWPKDQIDHIDGDTKNIKWENLREATRQQNGWNRKVFKTNKLGQKNIRLTKSGKFRLVLCIGVYDTLEEAIGIRNKALQTLQKEFAHKSVRDV